MEGQTEDQKQQIEETFRQLKNFLIDTDIHIAASALMLLTAEMVAPSTNTNQNILMQFEKCLKQERS